MLAVDEKILMFNMPNSFSNNHNYVTTFKE